MIIRIFFFSLALTATALAPVLLAEPTKRVRISFPAQCKWVKHVVVVVNGDELLSFPADQASANTWTGQRSSAETFNAKGDHASLRLDGARTDCRSSRVREEPGSQWVADFVFDCDEQKVYRIKVHTEPESVPVSYVRQVPATGKAGSVPCDEYGILGYGAGTIADVHLDSESVRLQVGREKAELESSGLLLDTLNVNEQGVVILDGNAYIEALFNQKASGDSGMLTNLSDDRPIERKRIENLKKIELKWLPPKVPKRKGR